MYRYKKDMDYSYTLGTTITFELLNRRPKDCQVVYINPKQKKDETYQKLVGLCRDNHIKVIENNEKVFKELSDKENTMVIGVFSKFQTVLEKEKDHLVLINPSNMGNMGTIIRSAVGFSIYDLAIITPACDIYDPKVVRASMGAIFNLRFELFPSFEAYKAKYGNHHAYPFMLQATTELKNVHIEKPFSIVFGNEATGLDRSFLNEGTPLIIPHSKDIDSLNLDNAVAIGLYEFTK